MIGISADETYTFIQFSHAQGSHSSFAFTNFFAYHISYCLPDVKGVTMFFVHVYIDGAWSRHQRTMPDVNIFGDVVASRDDKNKGRNFDELLTAAVQSRHGREIRCDATQCGLCSTPPLRH